jgi:ComF family protein
VFKDVVWHLKFQGARAAGPELGTYMADRLPDRQSDVIVVHVPTATSRLRRRGYDQARLIAGGLSKSSGLPHLSVLARSGQTKQVGASRSQRLAQTKHAYRVSHPKLVRGMHILLVDDVVTTGTTLETCARVLKDAGARRLEAAVFARA